MTFRPTLLMVFAGLVACSDGQGPPVVANNVVVTAPAPDMPMAAAYLEIVNQSGAAIRITGVSSPHYEAVEIHETTIEDGVARMREIGELDIADGEALVLERGGKHLMLMRPKGDVDIVTLNFHSDDLLIMSVSAELETAAQSRD